ncbi:NlpC/P60 family protein [uncultured Enorma sp.]|uniref:C40 family peptidase n=1 Tax=uncultured Enorma sp. TaxID=1714346 RepID=UPI002806120D|nr:NlpC/P60 family protein [uncultured Enorma sp.]
MHSKHTSRVLTLLVSAALALGTFPVSAFATPSSELQAQVNEAYSTLTQYANELESASNELYQLQQDLESTQNEIAQTEDDIAELEVKLEEGQEKLSERLAESYKQDTSSSPLSVIVGASDFEELVTRFYYANRMIDYDSELVEEVKSTREELQQRREDLAEQEAEQQQLVEEQEQKTAEIQAKVSEQQAYYEGLDSELQQQLAEEEARRAAEEAARQEAEQADREEQGNNGGSNTDNNGGSNNGGGNGGGSNNDSSNTDSGNAPSSVVDIALAQVGKGYVFATAGPNTFDCSGLVTYSYGQMGISITHSSQAQYNIVAGKGHLVYSTSYLSPGDLVFWGHGGSGSAIYHVGIYIGGGQYVHASSPGVGVVVSTLYTGGNFAGGGSPV